MRIAILGRSFPPGLFGGTEIASYNIAKVLSHSGHEILVITTWDSGLPPKTIENNFCIRRLRFSRNRIFKYLGLILFSIKTFLILREFKPDVIHAQAAYMGIPALTSSIMIKKPYIIWLQGSDIYLHNFLKDFVSKLVLSRSDVVIALTNDMREEARRFRSGEIIVLPNGVDLEKFKALSKEEARNKLHLPKDGRIVIFVGNLLKIKGVNYLVEAMKPIRREFPGVQLLLIGDGEERKRLEQLVYTLDLWACVSFIGAVPNERVSDYLCAADLFVLPSLSEGFPITLLEAMACGLPIIATRVRGLHEIIKDGENGFLVEPCNSTQIAEQSLFVMSNNTVLQNMSLHNKDYVRNLSWEIIGKRLEEIYSRLILNNYPN